MNKYALAASVLFALGIMPAQAAPADLVNRLRQGGYVLVMRHASAPANPPDKSIADAENTALERQLDEKGRKSAQAMGAAFRSLRIPVGEVLSSPTYRALQTVRLAGFGQPKLVAELGDQGRSMQRLDGPGRAAWLRAKAAEKPAAGNRLIMTHQPNIAGAFPDVASDVAEGESLVFKPDGRGHAEMIARVPIGDWGN